MSEEQSSFKVTDRRLFNADGTPRDIEREEEPSRPPTASAAAETAQSASAPARERAQAESASVAPAQTTPTENREQTSAVSAGRDDLGDAAELDADENIPGANDPASFVNFLMSIASNAAASLGMMEHPVTGERGVDLQLAKHWIDVLGMLQQKTRGNLAPQEQQIFEGLLSDLRMQFVSLTGPRAQQAAPRGFTGRDITGGK